MIDVAVVNSSPIIVLAKAGYLSLLTESAQTILVPETVALEILSGPEADPARQRISSGWGRRVPSVSIPPRLAALRLDPGETAVLSIALEKGNCPVVLDDHKARQGARALGLPVIGTLGIVLRAKQEGRIPSAITVLHTLRAVGLYLNDTILQTALETVGEKWS